MERVFYIKNMVCDRCKKTVEKLIHKQHSTAINIQLGRVTIADGSNFDLTLFKKELQENGFEWIQNPDERLVESIKVNLLNLINDPDQSQNLSDYLTAHLHKEYSSLSKVFKRLEGETIEKYAIKLKIEKVKEMIQMQALSFSEIAYQLGYRSISHLSGQFKSITGMTMSEYKSAQRWDRLTYDKIL